ncbi:acyl carrier protein 4, chloroplastic-like [Alnus glutinosa]|uniref:acyl carrier protein 4, chloroplastic-like n=1 Tax=Alnus glutinosa TaxID=3517 RepID=UPI002D770200|nr:acyl carrier protein 4, chloroplastic-like [Alnus glutinosa]
MSLISIICSRTLLKLSKVLLKSFFIRELANVLSELTSCSSTAWMNSLAFWDSSPNALNDGGPMIGGLRVVPKIQITKEAQRSSALPSCLKTTISCSIAQPETLQSVQGIISKQLSIDETTVTPQTKFTDLGADSLDIVEIMMALEEKFEVSIGEGGAENISTVQDAADLIEKVKATSA